MNHRPRLVAAIAAAAAIASAGISFGASRGDDRAHVGPARGDRAVITGCHAEDACRIDYRGNGRWIITRNGEAR